LLPQAGQITVFIPTHKQNMQKAIWMDYQWHQTLSPIITERFNSWRDKNFKQ